MAVGAKVTKRKSGDNLIVDVTPIYTLGTDEIPKVKSKYTVKICWTGPHEASDAGDGVVSTSGIDGVSHTCVTWTDRPIKQDDDEALSVEIVGGKEADFTTELSIDD